MIGVGNCALSDEGAGCRVARQVASRVPSSVDVVEAGLPGPGILALIEDRRKTVIIDAVDAGQPPGTVFRFRLGQTPRTNIPPAYSLHQGNIMFYMELARAMGMCSAAPDATLTAEGVRAQA